MKKIMFMLFFIVFSSTSLFAVDNKIFEEADNAFLQRAQPQMAFKALRLYREIYQHYPDNYEAAWRVSMGCYYLGFEVERNKEIKKKLFEEGCEAGLTAVKIEPNKVEGHFWVAINMALYGEAEGVVKMLFTLNTICTHLNLSISIDPSYAYGGAQRVLGKINESLPAILGGSNDLAEQYYSEAINVSPNEPLNYLFMAKLMLKTKQPKVKFIDMLRKGIAVNQIEDYRTESQKALKELEHLATKYDDTKGENTGGTN